MSEKMKPAKPCPFCNTKDLLGFANESSRIGSTVFWVICECCGANGPDSNLTEEAALRAWNTRAEAEGKE